MTQLDLATLSPPAAPGSAASPVEAGQTGDDLKLKPVSGLVRALVYLTDLACVFAVTGLLWWLFPSPVLAGITIAEAIVVLTLFRARTGRTPGALATGTAAVAHGSNHAPGLGKQLDDAAARDGGGTAGRLFHEPGRERLGGPDLRDRDGQPAHIRRGDRAG